MDKKQNERKIKNKGFDLTKTTYSQGGVKTKLSAKARALKAIYYYNAEGGIGYKTNYKPKTTEEEAKALLLSLRTKKEIEVYSELRELNMEIMNYYRYATDLFKDFTIDVLKLINIYVKKRYKPNNNISDKQVLQAIEEAEEKAVDFLSFTYALEIFFSKKGFKDRIFIISFQNMRKELYSYKYSTYINGVEEQRDFKKMEPDMDLVNQALIHNFDITE